MANTRRGNFQKRMAARPAARVSVSAISGEVDLLTSPAGQRRLVNAGGAQVVEKYLIDGKEAGLMLGLAAVTVMRLGNDGAFPVVRIGARVLYRVADIRAYADQLAADDVASHQGDTHS